MRRSLSTGLILVAAGVVGLIEARPTPAQNPVAPSDLVKEAIKKWQTDPDLKRFADAVDGAAPTPPPKGNDKKTTTSGTGTAKGYAIHVACEKVNPKHYKGIVPDLPATLNDLAKMQELSQSLGYEQLAVLRAEPQNPSAKATRENFLAALKLASDKANGDNGDIVLITYSGHGGQVPDDSANPDEKDGLDETLCLFDGQLVDDQIAVALSKFKKGVRIVMILDSCHSGTAFKGNQLSASNFKEFRDEKAKAPGIEPRAVIEKVPALKDKIPPEAGVRAPGDPVQVRALDAEVALATYEANEAEYKKAATENNAHPAVRDLQALDATLITLSACRDEQTALDLGPGKNGLYTRELLAIWQNGAFDRDYNEFQKLVREAVPPKARALRAGHKQEPLMSTDGAGPSFEGQPFLRIKK